MSRDLALIDGGNLIMRSASVMADTRNPLPDDFPRVAKSALRIALDFLATVGATHCIVAFDSPASWRKGVSPGYKASRTVDTAPWQGAAMEAFAAAGLRCVAAGGFEADDVIATLAGRSPVRTCLLSSDSDLWALLRDADRTVEPWRFGRKGEPYFVEVTPGAVRARFGVEVAQVTEYKAIVGEKGDDVPGVKGYGHVRAVKLLQDFGSLSAIIAASEDPGVDFPGRRWSPEDCDVARLAMRLVTLRTDVPVPAILPAECAL